MTGLYRRKARHQYGQAIVEECWGVREALVFMRSNVRDVYVTEEALGRHPDIDSLLQESDPYTHVLPADLAQQVAPNAQGLFVVISVPDEENLDEIMAQASLLVCAIETVDPGNLGTIIRSADASAADAVILGTGSVDATNPKVLRATAGSYFHLPIIEDEDVERVVNGAHHAGFQVLIADGNGEYDLGSCRMPPSSPGVTLARWRRSIYVVRLCGLWVTKRMVSLPNNITGLMRSYAYRCGGFGVS